MPHRLEERLQRDITKIREKVTEMGELAEDALRKSLEALIAGNRQLAYSVILRDRYIDELEKELDGLCQQFLVRQLPAAGNLRFVYGVIKINNELERVGDYAESIARQFHAITSIKRPPSYEKFQEIANLSISMLRNAIQAFMENNAELAKETIRMEKLEKKVDTLRYQIHEKLIKLRDKGKLSSEALPPLMIIASRFERVADQACNICEEVLFMTTGEDIKHEGIEIFKVLFVDEYDACRAQMAKGIANSLKLKNFLFKSAGLSSQPIDQRTVEFMKSKGIDISNQTSKYLEQITALKLFDVIISLSQKAEAAFPPPPTKTVSIRWEIDDPSQMRGSEKKIQAAYEKTYQYLDTHIRDLISAILGNDLKLKEENQ